LRIDEIQSRKSEIRKLLSSDKDMSKNELDILENEIESLNLEENTINQRSKNLDTAARLNSGELKGNIIDKGGSKIKMDTNVDIRSTEEYRNSFIKTLQGTATREERAIVSVVSGANVIPTNVFNQVIQNIQKQQGLLSRVRLLQIPGKLSIPLSDITTPAAWHTEGDEITETNLPPSNLTLSGFELAKLFSMSVATNKMSIPQYEDYLVTELTRVTGDALNTAILSGNGTGQPTGIMGLTWNAGNSLTFSANNIYQSLTNASGLLASNFRRNAAFIMNSNTLYSYVLAATDANGRPIFDNALASGIPLMLLGKEIILDDFVADNTILFGDPQFYFLNFSQPMAIEVSREAGFTKGLIVYRSIAVVDGKPLPSGAFVKITKA
jgi:HK97 family phage major capsid protein